MLTKTTKGTGINVSSASFPLITNSMTATLRTTRRVANQVRQGVGRQQLNLPGIVDHAAHEFTVCLS
ncbi:MAG: hypothetical protein ACLR23_15495 [Clostridia bacterium]